MSYTADALEFIKEQNPDQPEFIQAVEEVFESLEPEVEQDKVYEEKRILERLATPERIVSFRVLWEDDDGNIQINHGHRVQFHTLLGPAKGGLRFDPSVNLSVLSFLAFEQSFKNALTPLSLGSGKGGSDFNPDGRSDEEVMRFCRAFMTELHRFIGPHMDVPAGDIGVGSREIGYLFGQYRRLTGRWEGVLTGKGTRWGGSEFRSEATGVGAVEFASLMVQEQDRDLYGMRAIISGAGNVAIHAAAELIDRGARVLTLSDSRGCLHIPDGLTKDALAEIRKVKIEEYGHLESVELSIDTDYVEGGKPWGVQADLALPCATQNEVNGEEAEQLVDNDIAFVVEGANMPCTAKAHAHFRKNGVIVGPGKAANAGGVAISGLEMHQNATFANWPRERVREELTRMMTHIYDQCVSVAREFDQPDNLTLGSNIAGFRRLARAMLDQGHI